MKLSIRGIIAMLDVRGLAYATILLVPGAAIAQAPAEPAVPAALSGLQPGNWRLRMLEGSAGAARDICIADPRLLLQIRHGAAACERFVVADEAKVATVSYTCGGTASGRTSLRLAEHGVVRIDSQGIADNAPFAFVAEAQRTGACGAGAGKPAGSSVPADKPAAPAGAR